MKRLPLIFILMTVLSAALSALTLTACSDNGKESATEGLLYTLNQDGESYKCDGLGTSTATEIIIPSKYKGLPVTRIGGNAFKECIEITSVVIPDSVTSIGFCAFYECSALESVTIGDSVTTIEFSAFNKCFSLESVTIPDSVTTIGDSAFYDCFKLADVSLPVTVESLGSNVFNNTAYYNDENNWTDGVLYVDNYLTNAKADISGSREIRENTRIICPSAFWN